MLGREAPLDFFRRSGIPIRGEWKATTALAFAAFFLFCVFLYNWKANGAVNQYFQKHSLFPYNVGPLSSDPSTLPGRCRSRCGTPASTTRSPTAWPCSSSASAASGAERRRTSRLQTIVADRHPVDSALSAAVPGSPLARPQRRISTPGSASRSPTTSSRSPTTTLHGREYWRAFGFILAWPLFIWNVFTWKPMTLVARHLLRPDVRPHPAHHPPLGQGRLLRLDLLLRRAGRDAGRRRTARRCRTGPSGTA